jgi:hypothetical protein
VTASASSLTRFGQLISDTGDNLKQLDSGGWVGSAGQAFDAYFADEPTRWVKAGSAFTSAADALTGYASSLQWAQGKAGEAIALWQQGEVATEQAWAQHAAWLRVT